MIVQAYAVDDTEIRDDTPSSNYKTGTTVRVGQLAGMGPDVTYHIVWHSELAVLAIPAGSVINSAVVKGYVDSFGAGSGQIAIYKAGEVFDENNTWLHRRGSPINALWTTAGGTVEGSPVVVAYPTGSGNWSANPDVAAIVADALNNESGRLGLIFKPTPGIGTNANANFRSSDHASDNGLYVEIDYTPPANTLLTGRGIQRGRAAGRNRGYH